MFLPLKEPEQYKTYFKKPVLVLKSNSESFKQTESNFRLNKLYALYIM